MTHPVDNKLYLHDSGGSRLSDRGGGEGCHPVPEISGGPRGGLPYETDGDARRKF